MESADSTVRLNEAETVTPLPSATCTWNVNVPAAAGVPPSTDPETPGPPARWRGEFISAGAARRRKSLRIWLPAVAPANAEGVVIPSTGKVTVKFAVDDAESVTVTVN